MPTLLPKVPEQNEYEISNSCIADFNKLSQQRQIKILKQLSINARSFVQFATNEKKVVIFHCCLINFPTVKFVEKQLVELMVV